MDWLITFFEALNLYSSQNGLGEHLQGLDMQCNDYTGKSIYNMVFIWLFAVNSVIIINYYYGLFNRRPFNRWWWWLVNVFAGMIILFTVAYVYPENDLMTGNYCKDLQVSEFDCMGFALTAAIYSFIWSCLLTFLIKWKSSVNKKVPI